jgi:hypothetical protein
MIDPALEMSHAAVWLFWAKTILFIYITPVLLGFLVATLFPIGARFAAQHRPFVMVVLGSAIAPAVMLLGWSFVAREMITAPLYGLGYGLGIALLSRVHSIRLWPFRIVTRKAAYDRMAAAVSTTPAG